MTASDSLVIATLNQGKRIEIRQLLSDLKLDILSLEDFPATAPVPETGSSCADNAVLKAVGYALQTGRLTLADDSGLEVNALGGAPGVKSARYAGKNASDCERVEKLLTELRGVPKQNRGARFVAAIAIADERGIIQHLSIGKCEGAISLSPRGTHGFGYDPVFVPKGFDLTFGELESGIKNQISHRARALMQARDYLKNLTGDPAAG